MWSSCGGNPSTGGKTTTNLQTIRKYPKVWGNKKKENIKKFGDAREKTKENVK